MFEYIANILTYNLFVLESGSQIAEVVHFFIYDI
jgi:hypothetical protein